LHSQIAVINWTPDLVIGVPEPHIEFLDLQFSTFSQWLWLTSTPCFYLKHCLWRRSIRCDCRRSVWQVSDKGKGWKICAIPVQARGGVFWSSFGNDPLGRAASSQRIMVVFTYLLFI